MARKNAPSNWTYSWTSRTAALSQRSVALSTRSPAGPGARESELARSQRLEPVADRCGLLEVQVRGRRLHLTLEPRDLGIELRLGAERLTRVARHRRHVVPL